VRREKLVYVFDQSSFLVMKFRIAGAGD